MRLTEAIPLADLGLTDFGGPGPIIATMSLPSRYVLAAARSAGLVAPRRAPVELAPPSQRDTSPAEMAAAIADGLALPGPSAVTLSPSVATQSPEQPASSLVATGPADDASRALADAAEPAESGEPLTQPPGFDGAAHPLTNGTAVPASDALASPPDPWVDAIASIADGPEKSMAPAGGLATRLSPIPPPLPASEIAAAAAQAAFGSPPAADAVASEPPLLSRLDLKGRDRLVSSAARPESARQRESTWDAVLAAGRARAVSHNGATATAASDAPVHDKLGPRWRAGAEPQPQPQPAMPRLPAVRQTSEVVAYASGAVADPLPLPPVAEPPAERWAALVTGVGLSVAFGIGLYVFLVGI